MAQSQKRYSEAFKRQAVARMTASPNGHSALARELGVSRSLLYTWRKRYAAPHTSPSPLGRRGQGMRAAAPSPVSSPSPRADRGPGGEVSDGSEGEVALQDARLRRLMVETACALALAMRESIPSAPLNQLSAAFGLIIDRLLRLEALAAQAPAPDDETVIRIEYLDPDGSVHKSPPWARGDPAFEAPIVPGRVRSPFWDNRDWQADDPEEDPAQG